MSDKDLVEAPKAEDIDPDALFKEFGDKERAAAPDAAEEGPEDKGQVEAGLSGQPASDTPSEDAAEKLPASEEPAKPDWDNAPAPLREAYEASEKARRNAQTLVSSHAVRLTQAYQERDALNAKLAEAGKAAGSKTEQDGDETDEDYRKRMTEEYPEFARLFTRLDAAEAKVGELEGTVTTDRTTAAARQTEDALLEQGKVFETAHPDWETEKKDPAVQAKFLEWANAQPAYVQDALRRNAQEITDGASAADLISRFKQETADPAQEELKRKRAEQLEAGRDTRTSSPGATKTGAADNDTEGLWNEFKAADEKKATVSTGRR